MLAYLPKEVFFYIIMIGFSLFWILMEFFMLIYRTWQSFSEGSLPPLMFLNKHDMQFGVLPEDRQRAKLFLFIILGVLSASLFYYLKSYFLQFPFIFISLSLLSVFITFYTALVVPDIFFRFLFNKHLLKMNKQMIDVLNILSLTLRSAKNFEEALPIIASQIPPPLGAEFDRVVQEVNIGGDKMENALQRLAERVTFKDMEIFVSTVLIIKAIGGSQADLMDKYARLIRERFRIMDKIRALTAEGRFSAISIALAPLFVLIVNYFIDPDTISLFVKHPIGILILLGIGVSDYIGYKILYQIMSVSF